MNDIRNADKLLHRIAYLFFGACFFCGIAMAIVISVFFATRP